MIITNYKITDIENFEEFLNKLYNGLKYYEKRNLRFRFKLTFTEGNIELKTIRMNESIN